MGKNMEHEMETGLYKSLSRKRRTAVVGHNLS